MNSSNTSNRQGSENRSSTTPEQPRQELVGDGVQPQQIASNRDVMRRQARSAFRDSIAQERPTQRLTEQAGIEKMLRTVVRKESSQTASSRSPKMTQQKDGAVPQSHYVSEKLNSTYNQTTNEPTPDASLETSPSQRQQQRAIDDYQQSTRSKIDHTVELVI